MQLFGHIDREITTPVEMSDIAGGIRIIGDPLSRPMREFQRSFGPDTHQFSPHIQPEILMHAAKGLAAAKLAMSDHGDRAAVHTLVIQVQKHGCRAESAANDADVAAHAVTGP